MRILKTILPILMVVFMQSCAQDAMESPGGGSTGKAGSLARYTVAGPNLNYLYSVSQTQLFVTDISDLSNPNNLSTTNLNWGGVETIFPFQDYLLLGTQTGMLVYDLSTPEQPQFVSEFWHVRSCDPVVAQDSFAYVTLRGNGGCGGTQNELHVLDISQIQYPRQLHVYQLSGPYGLGIDGDELFVCDGKAGLLVYDASNPKEGLTLKQTFPGINAKDVIPYNGLLLMIGDDGFYQYSYTGDKVELLSKLEVKK